MNITPESTQSAQDKNCTNSARRILETAETFFARLGFVGTRVDEIARVACINKRMIYYHYGSKEGLYQAVLEKHLKPMIELSLHLLQEELHPSDMFARLLNSYFDFLSTHRLYVRLISWEVTSEGTHLSTLGFRRQTFEQVVSYFEAAQKQNYLRADLDVRAFLLAGMMLCFSYFSQMQYMQSFYDENIDQSEHFECWKRTVLTLMLQGSGLQPVPAPA